MLSMSHTKSQAMLQISRLLDFRDQSSPFTLVIDSLEQPAKPLVTECMRRAAASKTTTIYISHETLRQSPHATHFIPAYTLTPTQLASKVRVLTTPATTTSPTAPAPSNPQQKQIPRLTHLLVLDTLHPLASNTALNLPSYLTSLLMPTTALLCVYHADQPLSQSRSADTPPSKASGRDHRNPYAPSPLTHLTHLATTILTPHSPHHVLASRAARARSVQAPRFGLEEEEEGVLVGLGANDRRGTVVEIEMRRKSGRSAGFLVFLPSVAYEAAEKNEREVLKRWGFCLMEDCGLFRESERERKGDAGGEEESLGEVSFSLGLTEKQRRDREGVVLPYFDAQRDGGVGQGGRILYDMGEEDDFDEEEDEI